jgi:microcystin-dependent protein
MSIISGVSKSSRHSSTSKRRHHHHPHRRHRHSHGSRPVGSVSDYETTTEITNPTDIEATSCYDTEDTARYDHYTTAAHYLNLMPALIFLTATSLMSVNYKPYISLSHCIVNCG